MGTLASFKPHSDTYSFMIKLILLVITSILTVNHHHYASASEETSKFKIKPFSFPKSVVTGETVSVTCVLSTVTAQTDFKWLKDGVHLEIIAQRDRRYQLLTAKGASVLLINSVTFEDYGNFTCIANTPYGSDKYTAQLTIYTSPKWILELFDLSLRQGEIKILECLATGNPTPTISWSVIDSSQDGNRLSPINGKSGMTILSNGSLLIDSNELNSDTHVQCTADNKIGNAIEKRIKISLIVPAKIVTNSSGPLTRQVTKGTTISLLCQAFGDQPIEVEWLFDNKPINTQNNVKYHHYQTTNGRKLHSELSMRINTRQDGGTYTCTVKNRHNSDSLSYNVIVMESPEPPTNLKVVNVWSRNATISWSSPFNGKSPLISYILIYWKGKQETKTTSKLNEVIIDPNSSSYILQDLLPGTYYCISLIAVNKISSSPPSNLKQFATGEELPTATPVDVSIISFGARFLRLSWKAPPKQYWNGNLTDYYIYYRPVGDDKDFIKTVPAISLTDAQNFYRFNLSGLSRSTFYSITVKAFNNMGGGPASVPITVSTLSDDVPTPPIIKFHRFSSTSIKFSWNPSIEELFVYTIYLRRKGDTHYENIIPIAYPRTSYTLFGLEKDVDYVLALSASNSFGESELSKPIEFMIPGKSFQLMNLFGGNPLILIVTATCILAILFSIIVSAIYLKRVKRNQQLAIRRMSNVSTMSQKQIDKTGTMRSTATYATIGPPTGHVTIRSAGSSSPSSSRGYGRNIYNTSRHSNGSSTHKNFEELAYDDPQFR